MRTKWFARNELYNVVGILTTCQSLYFYGCVVAIASLVASLVDALSLFKIVAGPRHPAHDLQQPLRNRNARIGLSATSRFFRPRRLRTLCRWRWRHKLMGMSKEESIGAIRKAIEKMAAGFVASLEEKKPYTVILTTDGEKHRITDTSHPLPERYLEKWQEDRKKFDIDLSL